MSVVFSDPNSNSSTTCSKSWLDSPSQNTTGAPTAAYVLCAPTRTPDEDFEWTFTSYAGIQHFSIEFAHGWNDPACVPALPSTSRPPEHIS